MCKSIMYDGRRRKSWVGDWLPSWKPTSEAQLEAAETAILSCEFISSFLP